ncbi:MAG: Nif3-like dinuclear metal center hexameric protein [Sarcina sp.]
MLVNDFINIMEEIAPTKLKEDFDNVGLMVGDRNKEVKKILVALDCTVDVIEEAKKLKVDMILTHHPLIFKKPSTITTDSLLGRKIIELIKNDINLYSAHTNWDSVKGGINDKIVNLLGMSSEIIMDKVSEDAGIGRIVTLENKKSVKEIIELSKTILKANSLRYVGELEKEVSKIAIINGSGQSYLESARILGAELVITGDTSYHYASDYKEMGMSIIDIGHFASEWPVVIEATKDIERTVKDKFSEIEFIISEKTIDPYNFI